MDECRSCWNDWNRWEALQLFTRDEIQQARANFDAEKNYPWVYTAQDQVEEAPQQPIINKQIKKLLDQAPEIIVQPNGPPGRTGIIQHEIVLSDETPVRQRPYIVYDPRKRTFIQSEIK